MVAFHIRRERLEYWIRALSMFYYELYGNNSDFDINWYDDHEIESTMMVQKQYV